MPTTIVRTVPDFTELTARHRALPPATQTEVMMLRYQAIGYVWGWQDAGESIKDTGSSIDFGDAYWGHALDYAEEKSCFRINVPDAFKLWRETGAIKRP